MTSGVMKGQGVHVRNRRRKLQYNSVVGVRVSEVEKEKMIEFCEERGITISTFMRLTAIAAMVAEGVEV